MEIDAWLRNGGIVVTASDRAARSLAAAFHRARRAEGFAAWPAPEIRDWKSFARKAWEDRNPDGRLVLNAAQEASLWAEIAAREEHPATALWDSRLRIADLAMDAHDLLASHAPKYLSAASRAGWERDAAAFSGWLAVFDRLCREGRMLSASRLPLESIGLLDEESAAARPPLLLAGFDRILPVQRRLFDAWGEWREAAPTAPATAVHFYRATGTQAELAACALWCKRRLAFDPAARLLIVAQNAAGCRGELERALLSGIGPGASRLFEFTLGIPLSKVSVASGALLILRWLGGSLAESEVDWLISSGLTAANPLETSALQRTMRALRRRGLERTAWTLDAFCRRRHSDLLPEAWRQRMMAVMQRLEIAAANARRPIEWAALAQDFLDAAGWPGFRPLASAEFQAVHRWEQALDATSSLGFDGRRMSWREFLDVLARTLDTTLFAPESQDAPIQIAGPAESAGLGADAIWFLGADEDAWPPRGSPHPFLPLHVQREGAMPHSTAQLDWDLAHTITGRLLASAPEVNFSYAGQKEDVETRPSRVVAQFTGAPQPLPADLQATAGAVPITVSFTDASRIPFPHDAIAGGADALTAQSQCPFKAFATARLAAKSWEPAQAGLTPAQRGNLVHEVLHAVWAGPPHGIRTLGELRSLADLDAFVHRHVRRAMQEKIPHGVRETMPGLYLELEASRLNRLIAEWLRYESARQPFTVVGTELENAASVAGLMLQLRLDRIDRLNDGSLLVIDYKTGGVKPSVWDLPRPDDVQLPLYAAFAAGELSGVGGLVFAKVRTGKDGAHFAGRLKDVAGTLLHDVSGRKDIAKKPLTAGQLEAWREEIVDLARAFVAGRAEADPRDDPKTCERCKLYTLCRIHENKVLANADEEDDGEEAADE